MPQWGTSNETDYGILVAGLPLFMEFEAYNTTYPGYVVMMHAEGVVKNCTEGANPVGIADIAMATQDGNGSRRKALCDPNVDSDDDNPYVAGDQIKVICGPIIVKLVLEEAEVIVVGEKLECGETAGQVQDYICSTTSDPCAIVAEALEDVTTHAGECAYIMAKLLI